jgi:hypothetical protein
VNVSPSAVPALSDDLDAQSFRTVVERTAPFWEQTGRLGALRAARQLASVLESTPDPVARRKALAGAFRVLRVRDPLLLTSYYEPEIRVSERPDAVYPPSRSTAARRT